MVDYFNRLLIFQDTFKRSRYEFSPVLLELGVNKLLGGLHDCYLQDKVGKGFSYRLAVKCYLIKHEKMTFNNGSLDMHYKIAFAVFNHLVENHHDDVLDHFMNNEPGDYCSLLKNTIFKKMIDSGCEMRKALPSPPQSIPKNVSKENSLHCTLNRAQLEELATFVNTIHLNYTQVTADDLEAFFNCEDGFSIQPMVNRKAIYLLSCLCACAFISIKWQHAVASNNLLLSSTGDRYLDDHNLSSTLYSLRYKEKDAKEKLIKNFVDKLVKVK